MSECVVRMEIPKNCWVCPFGLDGYIWNENDARTHYVRFCSRHSGEEYHVLETDTIDRPWFCDSFICQLPEGHGRLVDAEEMYKKSEAFCNQCRQGEHDCEKCNYIVAQGYMYKSPTIVPAERSETCLD